MAEINERASTSDCPMTPISPTGGVTIGDVMRAQSGDAFGKLGAYVQGQVEGEGTECR